MTAIATLSISDLDTTINHEPRVSHRRLAQTLGMSRSNELARLIERNFEELERYGEVCGIIPQTTSKGGRPGKIWWLNEPQALLVIIRSDAPKAPDARQEVITVFMAYRRGTLEKPVQVREHRRAAPKRLPHDPRIVTLTPLEAHNLRALINTLPRLAEVQKQAEEVLRFARSPLAGPMYEAWHYPQIVLASLGPLLLRCQRAADSSRLTGR